MLRRNRAYRIAFTTLTIAAAVLRYQWLRLRARLPLGKPSAASWERAHARTGRAIYRLATHLGGAFIKLGQVLGARADFFPAAFVAPLRKLHDKVPARPLAELRRHIERELGRSLAEVFERVDERALAAASLAQVHRAVLRADAVAREDGEGEAGHDVVIKVQYPEARRLFPVDFGSLRRAVRVVRWMNRALDLRVIADELAEFVCLELDFAREARSTARVRAAFAGDASVRVPRVCEALSTDRLLVLEYLEGTPLSAPEALSAAGADPRAVAERVAAVYCAMIFEHGFFHGDPHPGNILVLAARKPDEGGAGDGAGEIAGGIVIGLLDFGLAKELPAGFAVGIARMIARGMSGDAAGAVAAAESVGFSLGGQEPEKFLPLIRMLLGDYGGPDRLLDALRGTSLEAVPSHFALIGRVFVLLNGVSHMLVPGERVIPSAVLRALMPHMAAQARAAAPAS